MYYQIEWIFIGKLWGLTIFSKEYHDFVRHYRIYENERLMHFEVILNKRNK